MADPIVEWAGAEVLKYLVDHDFEGLARFTSGKRLSGSEIEDAVRQYGRTIVFPPPSVAYLDSIPIENAQPPAWSVTMELYTLEEGRSDLSVELTVRQFNPPLVELNNIHVL